MSTPRFGPGGEALGPRVLIVGTQAADTLVGTAGDDVICALGGDDVVRGRGGGDVLFGIMVTTSWTAGRETISSGVIGAPMV